MGLLEILTGVFLLVISFPVWVKDFWGMNISVYWVWPLKIILVLGLLLFLKNGQLFGKYYEKRDGMAKMRLWGRVSNKTGFYIVVPFFILLGLIAPWFPSLWIKIITLVAAAFLSLFYIFFKGLLVEKDYLALFAGIVSAAVLAAGFFLSKTSAYSYLSMSACLLASGILHHILYLRLVSEIPAGEGEENVQ